VSIPVVRNLSNKASSVEGIIWFQVAKAVIGVASRILQLLIEISA
jgi:hypothetical protein